MYPISRTFRYLFPELEEAAIFPQMKSNSVVQTEIKGELQRSSLLEQEKSLQHCTRCALYIGRTQLVFGEGNPNAKVCFIGGIPSDADNKSGKIFQGPAGELLSKMIQAMGLAREDVYLCNILKCRPPLGHQVCSAEIDTCQKFLRTQLQFIAPKFIIALGETAAQTLIRTDNPLSALRGKKFSNIDDSGATLFATHHPEELLQDPNLKRTAWDDLKLAMQSISLHGKA